MEGWGKEETSYPALRGGEQGNRCPPWSFTGLTRNWANIFLGNRHSCAQPGLLTRVEWRQRQACRWQRRPLLFLSFPR